MEHQTSNENHPEPFKLQIDSTRTDSGSSIFIPETWTDVKVELWPTTKSPRPTGGRERENGPAKNWPRNTKVDDVCAGRVMVQILQGLHKLTNAFTAVNNRYVCIFVTKCSKLSQTFICPWKVCGFTGFVSGSFRVILIL